MIKDKKQIENKLTDAQELLKFLEKEYDYYMCCPRNSIKADKKIKMSKECIPMVKVEIDILKWVLNKPK